MPEKANFGGFLAKKPVNGILAPSPGGGAPRGGGRGVFGDPGPLKKGGGGPPQGPVDTDSVDIENPRPPPGGVGPPYTNN